MSEEMLPPPAVGSLSSVDTAVIQRSLSDFETRIRSDLEPHASPKLTHGFDGKERNGDKHTLEDVELDLAVEPEDNAGIRNNVHSEESPGSVEIGNGVSIKNETVAYTSTSTPSVSSSSGKIYSRSISNVSVDSGLGAMHSNGAGIKNRHSMTKGSAIAHKVSSGNSSASRSALNIRSLKRDAQLARGNKERQASMITAQQQQQQQQKQQQTLPEDDGYTLGRFESVDLKTVHVCELCKTNIPNEILLHPCKCVECGEAYAHPKCLTSMREVVHMMCYNPCPCAVQPLEKKKNRAPHSSTPILSASKEMAAAGKDSASRTRTQPLASDKATSPHAGMTAHSTSGRTLHPHHRATSTSPSRSSRSPDDDFDSNTDRSVRRRRSGNAKRMLSSGARYLKHGVSSTVSGMTSAVSGTFGASDREMDRQRGQTPTKPASHNASLANVGLASDDTVYTSATKNNSFTNTSYAGSTGIAGGGGKDQPSVASSKGMAFTVSMYSAYSPLQAERAAHAQVNNEAKALAQTASEAHLSTHNSTRRRRDPSPEIIRTSYASLASQSLDQETNTGFGDRRMDMGQQDRQEPRQRALSEIRKRSMDSSGSATSGSASYTAKGEASKSGRRHTPQLGKPANSSLTVTQSAAFINAYGSSENTATTTNNTVVALTADADFAQDASLGHRVRHGRGIAEGVDGDGVRDRSRSASPLHKTLVLHTNSSVPLGAAGLKKTPPPTHKSPPFARQTRTSHTLEQPYVPTNLHMERTRSNPLHTNGPRGVGMTPGSEPAGEAGSRGVSTRHRRSLSAQTSASVKKLAKMHTAGSVMSTVTSGVDLSANTEDVSANANAHSGDNESQIDRKAGRRRSGTRTGLTDIGETTIKEFAQKRSDIHNQTKGLSRRAISMSDMSNVDAYNLASAAQSGSNKQRLSVNQRKRSSLVETHTNYFMMGMTVEELELKIDFLQSELGAQSIVLIELQQERENLILQADSLQIQAHKLCRELLSSVKPPKR